MCNIYAPFWKFIYIEETSQKTNNTYLRKS